MESASPSKVCKVYTVHFAEDEAKSLTPSENGEREKPAGNKFEK